MMALVTKCDFAMQRNARQDYKDLTFAQIAK